MCRKRRRSTTTADFISLWRFLRTGSSAAGLCGVAPSRYFEMVYNAKAYLHYGRNYETSPDDNCAENFFNATRYNQIINNYTNH